MFLILYAACIPNQRRGFNCQVHFSITYSKYASSIDFWAKIFLKKPLQKIAELVCCNIPGTSREGVNPLTLRAAQNRPYNFGNIFLTKASFWKIIEREMLKKSQTTTFLQIFYELLLYSQINLKSMRVAADSFQGIFECEWVKHVGLAITSSYGYDGLSSAHSCL